MKIFNFCEPSLAISESNKYIVTKGSFLLHKLEQHIPKKYKKLFNQIVRNKEKILYNHPRSWHFVNTTQDLISNFLYDKDPPPDLVHHLYVDETNRERILELHLFNAIELGLIYSKINNCSCNFHFNFQFPFQTYLPGLGHVILKSNIKNITKISYDTRDGVLINDKKFDQVINSEDYIKLDDSVEIKFNTHTFNIAFNDPILNNPFFANGPIIKNYFALDKWINSTLMNSFALIEKLFPNNFLNILKLSSHYFFIHNSSDRFSSASSEKIPGIIYLPYINNIDHLAECIIHENLHQLLFRLEKIINIYKDGQNIEKYWSPWRDDPRPLRMIMHGSFVFAGVAEFWERKVENNDNFENLYQFYFRVKQVEDGLKVLEKHANYSSGGKTLHRKVFESINNFEFDFVPKKIRKKANQILNLQRKKIDNEHFIGF